MKFGKRLAAEASRRWTTRYIDYKRLKKAIKEDLRNADAKATHYRSALLQELSKVSAFYCQKEQELADALSRVNSQDPSGATSLLIEIQELQKFVALNYLAVIKASKKCNRRLKEALGDDVPAVQHHLEFLSHEEFFTSPRLAQISTQAEILAKEATAEALTAKALEDYQCPICLDVLHSPVVLTCAHRFCWGCLLGHCTTYFQRIAEVAQPQAGDQPMKDAKHMQQQQAQEQAQQEQVQQEQVQQAPLQQQQQQLPAKVDAQPFYNCPVCRKPQVLDVDVLHTDVHLSDFIEGLKKRQQGIEILASSSSSSSSAQEDAANNAAAGVDAPAFLLPPRSAADQERMTVLLDLDGTLVASYAPKRAPPLPPSVRTHFVGVGSQLNPQGVFVVERPGLQEFLAEVSQFAEVVIFTAGLEDYARPIIEALDPEGKVFAGCIFREGTVKTSYYQCVKDMGFVGRPLDRTLLVDDTALAFLHQPDNGIPVQGFRGDADDQLLLRALLPLLQELAAVPDVRTVLKQRFNMASWFSRHGYPISRILEERDTKAPQACAVRVTADCRAQPPAPQAVAKAPIPAASSSARSAPGVIAHGSSKPSTLLLLDFDKTLTDWDAGERLFEVLAPELLPMLRTLEMPANFIPITNTLLAELQRRGVSRDRLLTALREQGAEVPAAPRDMLQLARARGADVVVLSDCNSIFISQILTGAKLSQHVTRVITNPAAFERVMHADAAPAALQAGGSAPAAAAAPAPKGSAYKLTITPCQCAAHNCARCPENLCKGLEVSRLLKAGRYDRIIFCGDGANDICPSLKLRAQDLVLARQNHSLGNYFQRAHEQGEASPAAASVRLWRDHDELLRIVADAIA